MDRLTTTSLEHNARPSPLSRWRRIRDKLRWPFNIHKVQGFKDQLSQLTLSQWSYLAAFIALLLTLEEVDKDTEVPIAVMLLAGVGLAREMWHLFHKIWEHTLGKGLLLVLYAGTANLAVALAALKINKIAGVEPSPFVFTLGFTTLLTLPFWLIAATVFLFSLALVAGNLWLLCALLLRLVGIRLPIHWEDKSFAISFMILRIVIIPVVIAGLLRIIEPYAEQLDLFEPQIHSLSGPLSPEQLAQLKQLPDADPQTMTALIEGIQGQTQDVQTEATTAPQKVRLLDRIVANFIFNFETYPYSACAKEPQQHSLTIDDYSMLVAEKDDSELGFSFSVAPCSPRYQASSTDAAKP